LLNALFDKLSGFKLRSRYALLFVLGALTTLALAPFFFTPLIIPAFSILLFFTENSKTKKEAFLVGWWFAFGYFISGLYWFAHALMIDAKQFAWLIPFADLGLPALFAIYSGLATLLTYFIKLRGLIKIVAFAVCFSALEYVRGHLFTGFPWNLTGYVWADLLPMMQFASIVGVYGLSFITIIFACAPLLLLSKGGSTKFIAILCAFLALYVAGNKRVADYPTNFVKDVTLRIVQANIEQKLKWEPNLLLANLEEHMKLSVTPSSTNLKYLVWPESAVPFPINDENLLKYLKNIVPQGGFLLTGSDRVERHHPSLKWWNTLSVINDQGKIVASADKTHLLPFGDYMPFRNILPIEKIAPGTGDCSRGNGLVGLNIDKILPRFTPFICYEMVFPMQGENSVLKSNWMLNVTNDGWFGYSIGPYQHFYMARMRSVEQGLPLVRAANTGISGVIDPVGRIIYMLKLGEKGVIDAYLPEALNTPTIYSIYGDKVFFAITLIACLSIFCAYNYNKRAM
jgi:apolipoprotein N-acyltransferase